MAEKRSDSPHDWPRAGDKLFAPGDEWRQNAYLDFHRPEIGIYAHGYRQAAEMLVEATSRKRLYLNFCIYPIVFLYRHYVELQLKEIVNYANHLRGRDPRYPQHHDLLQLWKEARKLLERTDPEGSRKYRNLAERLIKELAKADPASFAFRYPVNKKGEPSLPRIPRINTRLLKDAMARLGNYLRYQAEALALKLDEKREFDDY